MNDSTIRVSSPLPSQRSLPGTGLCAHNKTFCGTCSLQVPRAEGGDDG
ncbi:hypothetical protein [Massilia sp. 9I]|nr:hypothetical protein [Massilia sp. 9I]